MKICHHAFKNCKSLKRLLFNNISNNIDISILPTDNLSNDFHIIIPNNLINKKTTIFHGINYNKIISKLQENLNLFRKNKNANIYLAIQHLKFLKNMNFIIDYLIKKYELSEYLINQSKEYILV